MKDSLENTKKSRFNDIAFLKELKGKLIEEVTERITDPQHSARFSNPELLIQQLESGQKISHGAGNTSSLLEDLVIKVGQDFRLNPDEIDELFKEIFI